jgi:hypothetical protein
VSSPERPQAFLLRIDVGHQVSVKATLNMSLDDKESLRTRERRGHAGAMGGSLVSLQIRKHNTHVRGRP